MPRKTETPKISLVTVTYNGNVELFDQLIENLINEYLTRYSMTNIENDHSVQKVELSEISA